MDTPISGLPAATSVLLTDIVPTVILAGPTTKKITWGNMLASFVGTTLQGYSTQLQFLAENNGGTVDLSGLASLTLPALSELSVVDDSGDSIAFTGAFITMQNATGVTVDLSIDPSASAGTVSFFFPIAGTKLLSDVSPLPFENVIDFPQPLPVANVTFASQAISGTSIDWSMGNVFYKTLSGNITFTFANLRDGQVAIVIITNTTGNYTVTWPTVSWPGGSAPVQTVGAHTDVWTFVNRGGTIYGSVVQNF